MKTAPEVAREVLHRISDGRMADDCGGKAGCPYCKPYIDAIAEAIAAAEARGWDAGLMEAAKVIDGLVAESRADAECSDKRSGMALQHFADGAVEAARCIRALTEPAETACQHKRTTSATMIGFPLWGVCCDCGMIRTDGVNWRKP